MIDGTIRAAALGILVIIAVGLVGQYYFVSNTSQPFSEVGILGPKGEFNDYPTQMTVGVNYSLNLYVVNNQGQSMMYAVYEELGNLSSIINQSTPLAASPVATYWFALPNGGNYTLPIIVKLSSAGQNVRLVWELWGYSESTATWTYTGAWAQLFVNATVL
jgi:uncharacterized membrane protein